MLRCAVFGICLVTVAAFSLAALSDAVVTFPDPGLEAAIREAIGKPVGDIYELDLIGLTSLDAQNRSISDLAGIEHCVSLERLFLSGFEWLDPLSINQISDLGPLSGLTNLEDLRLFGNQISDLGALAGLTRLQFLDVATNRISDLAPLAGLAALTYLNLHHNQIGSLAPLASLTGLTELYLHYNQISDLGPLSGLTSLRHLHLVGNQVRDITPLAGLTALVSLHLWDNQISDLGPLSRLANLQMLLLGDNQISDLGPLARNSGIGNGDHVDVRRNYLCLNYGPGGDQADINLLAARGVSMDCDPQIACRADAIVTFPDPGLEAAIREAIGKPTGDIYESDLIDLVELDTRNRGILVLDGIEHCVNIRGLDLYNNRVSDVTPLAGMHDLVGLNLGANRVHDITALGGLAQLESLNLAYNYVNDIAPLATLTKLSWLDLRFNTLGDLGPLAGLVELGALNLWGTTCSDISPLSRLTRLEQLHLSCNTISDITALSGLINLRVVDMWENQISSIAPLVSNMGLGSGDEVNVTSNNLDLTPGSRDMQDVQALLQRGVALLYVPQHPWVEPPVAPAGLLVTAVSSSQIDLSWQDNSNNETGFKIERTLPDGTYSQVGTVGVDETTYSDTGLASATTYCYRVRAYNTTGDSGYSNESCATTAVGCTTCGNGDIGGDGVVDILDARLCLQIATGDVVPTQVELAAADVDGDGNVDLDDARILAEYVIGVRTTLP